MRVLVVDDNRRMRSFITSVLADPATDFFEAADGEHAVALYAACRPDVVLMDIRMPGMDGLEATRRIMREDQSAKVIIVTDFDSLAYRIEARVAGAKGFVAKSNLLQLREQLTLLFPKILDE